MFDVLESIRVILHENGVFTDEELLSMYPPKKCLTDIELIEDYRNKVKFVAKHNNGFVSSSTLNLISDQLKTEAISRNSFLLMKESNKYMNMVK